MRSGTEPNGKTTELLQRLLSTMQDLFILEALQAGAKGEAIRAMLRVDKWRVTNVSKLLKKRTSDAN